MSVSPSSSVAAGALRGQAKAVRSSAWWLAFALTLYVGLRVAILHTNFDAVAMPNYELGTIGNLALVLAEQQGGPPLSTHFDNVGGHLVVGALATPVYALLDQSYLALKLVPLLLGVGTLLLIWRLLSRHFDRRAALLAVLLFAVAPPTLTKYSLIAKGNHFENLFFQLWFLNAFFDLHAGLHGRRALLWTGLAAGVAVFVYTGSLLLVASACVVHVLVRGWRQSARDLGWAGPSFAIGAVPLVWLDLATHGREREFLATRFVQNRTHAAPDIAVRWVDFWTDVLPHSPCFEGFAGIAGTWANWLLLACFACAWIALARDAWLARKSVLARHATRSRASERSVFHALRTTPWLVHLPAMSLLSSAFDFPFKAYSPPIEVGQYRYLVPHFLWALLLIAVAGAKFLGALDAGARWAGRAFVLAACATGLFTLPIVRMNTTEKDLGTHYEGYWFEYYANVLLRDRPWVVPHIEQQLEQFAPTYRRRSIQGVGFFMTWMQDDGGQTRARSGDVDLAALVKQFSARYMIDVAHGTGSYLRRAGEEGTTGLERLQRTLGALDRERDLFAPYVVEGLALDLKYPLAISAKSFIERGAALATSLTPDDQRYLQRGLGIACGRPLPRRIPIDRALLHEYQRAAPDALRPEFYFGVGWGTAESTNPRDHAAALRSVVPPTYRGAAWQGFGAALRHNYGSDEGQRVWRRSAAAATPEEARAVERGLAWIDYPRWFTLVP